MVTEDSGDIAIQRRRKLMGQPHRRRSAVFMAAVSVLVTGGCGGSSAYRRVFQEGQQPINSKTYPVSADACWMAVSRAVLALNFGIDQQDQAHGILQASRYFKEGKRTTSITLKVNVQPEGQERSHVYATAVQATERVFARSHTRFFLWLIPLPGGGGTEASRVKEGEWTVDDTHFYESFFQIVDRELGKNEDNGK